MSSLPGSSKHHKLTFPIWRTDFSPGMVTQTGRAPQTLNTSATDTGPGRRVARASIFRCNGGLLFLWDLLAHPQACRVLSKAEGLEVLFKRCFRRGLRDNKKIICSCVSQLTRLLISQTRQLCPQGIKLAFLLLLLLFFQRLTPADRNQRRVLSIKEIPGKMLGLN